MRCTIEVVRFALGLCALVLVGFGGRQAFNPSTWRLAEAVADLGPISGWRCAQSRTYVYDPRSDRRDTTLVSAAPEAIVRQAVPGAQVERVEVDLQIGQAVASAQVVQADGTEATRVYVLSPGRLRATTFDEAGARVTVCDSHLSDWHIVGEQALG